MRIRPSLERLVLIHEKRFYIQILNSIVFHLFEQHLLFEFAFLILLFITELLDTQR
jgi:hypothetical protein